MSFPAKVSLGGGRKHFFPFGNESLSEVLVLLVLTLLGLRGAITAALSNTTTLQRTSSWPAGGSHTP